MYCFTWTDILCSLMESNSFPTYFLRWEYLITQTVFLYLWFLSLLEDKRDFVLEESAFVSLLRSLPTFPNIMFDSKPREILKEFLLKKHLALCLIWWWKGNTFSEILQVMFRKRLCNCYFYLSSEEYLEPAEHLRWSF